MKTKKNKFAISIDLTEDIKNLLETFSKAKGISMSDLVEEAILEHIEDEMDRSVINAREHEDCIEWMKKKRA